MTKTTVTLFGFLFTAILMAQDAVLSAPSTPNFSAASAAINTAIAQNKLPGAVLLVGHNGKIVFEQAYGVRKLAGEPGLDGKPSPAEPMTLDTIFDMASMTKVMVTSVAILQLYEAHKLNADDPVVKYLPEFATNPSVTSTANVISTPGATTPDTNSAPAAPSASSAPAAPGANSPFGTNSNLATALSANGATTYQPGPQAQVQAQNGAKRAEGPTHSRLNKSTVTIRELLTHYSGLPPDVDLKDAWGLAAPDKAEGIRRAMDSPLVTAPGTHFEYSDINYIVLGALVEKLSGERLDAYAQHHIFERLKMTHTSFFPLDTACGVDKLGTAVVGDHETRSCPPWTWYAWGYRNIIAPTAHDGQGTAETNPDFDRLLRGTVHDPTTRRMGGVAGEAGVFSTAGDIALFAEALLDKLLYDKGPFPLKQSTLKLMTTPQQPKTALANATIFTPDGNTATGVAQRGFGWDINSAYSRPRGTVFPIGSFGHTGFTGTSLWVDPASDAYVILLANSVHPRGRPSISPLRGEVATAVAKALGAGSLSNDPAQLQAELDALPGPHGTPSGDSVATSTGIDVLETTNFAALKNLAAKHGGHLRIGLLTNQTGLDSQGSRTIDILRNAGNGIELVKLFSPEHGLFGAKDSENIGQEVDPTTGLKVISLYGPKDTDKRPKPEDLKDLDAVVIDLQDAGVRFYTYETVLGYFVEASSCEQVHQHPLEIVVLDRPALIGGFAVQGPVSDTAQSYINYSPEPVRSGMTPGELAKFFSPWRRSFSCGESASTPNATQNAPAAPTTQPDGTDPLTRRQKDLERLRSPSALVSRLPIGADGIVTVIPMQNWHRSAFFDQTGIPWVNPSPNLRSVNEATLYPGLGMLDFTNVSVGRGTETPFEIFGAGAIPATKDPPAQPALTQSWFNGNTVAAYLTARKIPGVTFAAAKFSVAEDTNHYPYHGQTIQGVRLTVTDRNALDSPELGIEILSALHHLYPKEFQLAKAAPLVANTKTMAALTRGDDPRAIAASWAPALAEFKARRAKYLLYP